MKKRMELPQKMRFKILVLCLACTMTALLLQTWLFNRKSSTLIYNQAKKESFSLLQNMQDDLFTILKSMENNIIKVYNRQQLIRDLKEKESISLLRDKYYRESYNIAMECFDTSDGVVALYLYNGEDEIISTYRRAVTPRHNYPLDIYENAEENNADLVRQYAHSNQTTMLVSSYFNPNRDTDIIRLVMKLYNNSNTSQMIGYIACDVDSKIFRYRMEKFITDSDMFMWLQPVGDRAAVSVGSLGKNDRKLFDGITDHLCRGEQDFSLPTGGSQRVFFQMDQNKYNLSAYALMPQALLAANQRTLTASLFTIAAVMLVITLVFTFLWSKSLTRPLEELTEMTDRIKKGETDLRVAVKKHDEIGALGQSFNEMLDQIEALLVREYETKLLLNRAEYNALQAQINPHFISNVLNNVVWMAKLQHADNIVPLIHSLNAMLQNVMHRRNDMITLEDELEYVDNYLTIVEYSGSYDFAVEKKISEDAKELYVPRFILQPIMENAIYHGLPGDLSRQGLIRIEAWREDDKLNIVIEDNGEGMTKEQIEAVLSTPAGDRKRFNGIGISNVNARIRLFFGEDFGIRYESSPGNYTKAVLLLPAVDGAGEE